MKTIFVYSPLSSRQKEKFIAAIPETFAVRFAEEGKKPEEEFLSTMEILFGNPPVDWLENAKNLEFWQLDSAGFANYSKLSLKALTSNMGNFFSRPCAETIVGGLLSLFRGLNKLAEAQEKKEWIAGMVRQKSELLSGKKTLILGAGSIAIEIKKLLTAFDCPVTLAARTNPAADIHSHDGVVNRIPEFDLVINTLPGVAEKAVSAEIIAAMKDGVFYASIGRGITTDEDALIAALQSGKIAGAVLDVTEKEPLPTESPLWSMPRVILTQHTGGGFATENEGKMNQFLENFRRFSAGEVPENLVTLGRGY